MSADTHTPTTGQGAAPGGAALSLHLALAALVAFLVAGIWAATGGGSFWPIWVWFGLAVPASLHAGLWRVTRMAPTAARPVAIHGTLTSWVCGVLVTVWALAGTGGFWPGIPLIVLATLLSVHAVIAYSLLLRPAQRERRLTRRVDELTRTRRGALDVQAAELRRIERDLHDGAQARLVALSMQLGRAEERLGDRPDEAELVRAARVEAGAAIAELRDLARGIAPPVLADRGLEAAIAALAQRAPLEVSHTVVVGRRLPPVVEAAAYFVVAESLTNAAKHGRGAGARVSVVGDPERLLVEVSDDGPGDADPHGSGLTGLRHRVEALDGTLHVVSPAGGGTRIMVALPCGS